MSSVPVIESRETRLWNKATLLLWIVTLLLIIKSFSKTFRKIVKNRVTPNNSSVSISNDNVHGLDAIPGIEPVSRFPLIGNIPIFLPVNKLFKYAEKQARNISDVARVVGLGQTFVVLNSPEKIECLLKSTDLGHINKTPLYRKFGEPFLTKNSVLIAGGKNWQMQRKVLQKSQKYSAIMENVGLVCGHSMEFVKDLEQLFEDGTPKPIHDAITNTFFAIITELTTGYRDEGKLNLAEYHHNFKVWLEYSAKPVINPLLNLIWWVHPAKYKIEKAVNSMKEFSKQRISEQREKRKLGVLEASKRNILDDWLDEGLDEEIIIDEINTLFFAGLDTGATVFHFLVFMLALNSNVQLKCQTEVDSLFSRYFDECENGKLSLGIIHDNLQYVECCIMETMRLFPPAFLLFRELSSPLRIEYMQKTIEIPSGTTVSFVPYLIHRNEKYYPNPEKFNPDRFLPEERAKRHPYAFIPFSGGIRNCVGQKFAMVELKVLTAYVVRHFQIETTDSLENITLLPHATLISDKNMSFRFKKRT